MASPTVRQSTSDAGRTATGRRRAKVPCRRLSSPPGYSGRITTSWPASWTAIISFTTKGWEGSGGWAGMT